MLNNLVNSDPGAKTLNLRGANLDQNAVNSVLADNGGALSISKQDGGTWILNGANTFTGVITVSGGLIGVGGSASSISASAANPLGMNYHGRRRDSLQRRSLHLKSFRSYNQ